MRGEIGKNPNKGGGGNKNTEEHPKYAIQLLIIHCMRPMLTENGNKQRQKA